MTQSVDLSELDAEWNALAAGGEPSDEDPAPSSGAFGHVVERRLGLRVRSGLWALLRDDEHGVYARAVELSATGTVLKLMSPVDDLDLRREGALELDLFVPGASRPVHSSVRLARRLGELIAFEFSSIDPADRLTLAEHLDRLSRSSKPRRPASREPRRTPPAAFKQLLLTAWAPSTRPE